MEDIVKPIAEDNYDLKDYRTYKWLQFIVNKTNCRTQDELNAHLLVLWGIPKKGEAEWIDKRWSNYGNLRTAPTKEIVEQIERVVPGSKAEYVIGPQGQPLWTVLGSDLGKCEIVLVKVLASFKAYELDMSIPHQAMAFLRLYGISQTKISKDTFETLPAPIEWKDDIWNYGDTDTLPTVKKYKVREIEVDEFDEFLDEHWNQIKNFDKPEMSMASLHANRIYQNYMKAKAIHDKPTKLKFYNKRVLDTNLLIGCMAFLRVSMGIPHRRIFDVCEYMYEGIQQAVIDNYGEKVAKIYKDTLPLEYEFV